jgi:NADH:ubiquinone oxidoreductase subunit C
MLTGAPHNSRKFFQDVKGTPLLFQHASYVACTLGFQVNAVVLGTYVLDCLAGCSVKLLVIVGLLSCTSGYLFSHLIDIYASDYPTRKLRFNLVYVLRSPLYSATIQVGYALQSLISAGSVRRLYAGALWLEREIWDLFGLHFSGHGDLRRLLTDYGFEWSPLRKDFPLCGFLEVFYNAIINRVVYSRLSLAQEYRRFVFARKRIRKDLRSSRK